MSAFICSASSTPPSGHRRLWATERTLLRHLHRLSCPDPLRLLAHATGLLVVPAITAHLDPAGDGCPLCQEEVAACLLPARPMMCGDGGAGCWEAGPCLILADSLPSLAHPGGYALHGSVVAQDPALWQGADRVARLHDGATDEMVGEIPLTAAGGFVFDGLPPGCYRLLLWLPPQRFLIEPLVIGGPGAP